MRLTVATYSHAMKKTLLLLFLALIIFTASTSFAQECNCAAAFKWAKQAFEENDAGFQYILDQKGKEAYELHNRVFQQRMKKINNADSCVRAVRDWAKFFRVGHFGFIVNQTTPKNSLQNNSVATSKRLVNTSHARYSPYVQDYDSSTVYVRIPTFDSNYKREIDSVIHSNQEKILSRKNLIIDISDNGGGDDASYDEIIPILYTNPIRSVTVARLSTPNNNKFWQERLAQKDLPESYKTTYARYLDTLNAHPGKFVRLSDSDVYTMHYGVKHPLPQNVGIIINGNNGSTAEQFLLAAKQSKKVKLFGTTTMGELDISNMYNITSPDGKFTLWYCMSKSLRVPDNTIDNKGIAPDFYIDKTIPKDKWLPYVAGVMHSW